MWLWKAVACETHLNASLRQDNVFWQIVLILEKNNLTWLVLVDFFIQYKQKILTTSKLIATPTLTRYEAMTNDNAKMIQLSMMHQTDWLK